MQSKFYNVFKPIMSGVCVQENPKSKKTQQVAEQINNQGELFHKFSQQMSQKNSLPSPKVEPPEFIDLAEIASSDAQSNQFQSDPLETRSSSTNRFATSLKAAVASKPPLSKPVYILPKPSISKSIVVPTKQLAAITKNSMTGFLGQTSTNLTLQSSSKLSVNSTLQALPHLRGKSSLGYSGQPIVGFANEVTTATATSAGFSDKPVIIASQTAYAPNSTEPIYVLTNYRDKNLEHDPPKSLKGLHRMFSNK